MVVALSTMGFGLAARLFKLREGGLSSPFLLMTGDLKGFFLGLPMEASGKTQPKNVQLAQQAAGVQRPALLISLTASTHQLNIPLRPKYSHSD